MHTLRRKTRFQLLIEQARAKNLQIAHGASYGKTCYLLWIDGQRQQYHSLDMLAIAIEKANNGP